MITQTSHQYLIDLFHSDVSLKNIERQCGIDQRFVRKLWKHIFGVAAVEERGRKLRRTEAIRANTINDARIDQVCGLVAQNGNVTKAAAEVGVSPSWVRHVIAQKPDLRKSISERAKMVRSLAMRQL